MTRLYTNELLPHQINSLIPNYKLDQSSVAKLNKYYHYNLQFVMLVFAKKSYQQLLDIFSEACFRLRVPARLSAGGKRTRTEGTQPIHGLSILSISILTNNLLSLRVCAAVRQLM